MKSSDEQKSNTCLSGRDARSDERHTPAPWHYNGRMQRVEQVPAVFGRDYFPIASPYNRNAEADGRLIAAAPDLLQALMWLLEHPACQASYSEDTEMARRVDRGVTAVLKAGVKLPDEWPPATPDAIRKAEA